MKRMRGPSGLSLRDAWDAQAGNWIRWAQTPGHDSYWLFHRDRFLELVPSPGAHTLDVGCGEGRLARDLAALGHRVVGIDASVAMIEAARASGTNVEYVIADAAELPFPDHAFDLVLAFMSLQDIDDMPRAVAEAARVLMPGGRLCLAVVHPISSAGGFADSSDDSPFVIEGEYLAAGRYRDEVERGGLEMVFHSEHRTIEDYSRALEAAGFLIERVREVTDPGHPRWRRMPLFLHMRAVAPGR
jgi:SAM-dependent methyltransferase